MGRRQTAIVRTRDRIVAAAFDLHATVGPSRTTVSAIADRAGVQRHTVYSHFPDLETLYEACTTHGMEMTRMPTATPWADIGDPVERLRSGLTALMAWYRTNSSMLETILSDTNPTAPPPASPDPFTIRMDDIRAALSDGWKVSRGQRARFDAVLDHAIAFQTWRSLSGAGLTDRAVVDLLVAIARRVADDTLEPVNPRRATP